MSTNAQLIVPDKIKTHQPKPTKAQLVDALFQRAKENHAEHMATVNIRRREIMEEVKAICESILDGPTPPPLEIEENTLHRCSTTNRQYYSGMHASVTLTDPRLTRLADEDYKLGRALYFDDRAALRKIRESLVPSNPLLDPSMKDALDKMLSAILPSSKAQAPCISV